jgi:hypothetical protein
VLDLAVPLTAFVFIAIAVALVLRFRRRVPPPRSFVRDREEDRSLWEAIATQKQMSLVHAILVATCDAYLLDSSDAWRLRPTDKVKSIYQSFYPRGTSLGDTLEHETLFDALHQQFGVSESMLHHLVRRNATLADLVASCLNPSR